MSLFFDAAWFDARLESLGLDRGALAVAAGLTREDLHQIIINEREASAAEIEAFATVLRVDLVEATLRSGVAARAAPESGDPDARLDDLDARLDRIDRWLEELAAQQKPEADYSSPGLGRKRA
jgi:hypothetical protein